MAFQARTESSDNPPVVTGFEAEATEHKHHREEAEQDFHVLCFIFNLLDQGVFFLSVCVKLFDS